MERPLLSFRSVGLSRRWVNAINGASSEVLAFSPFITNCSVTSALEGQGSNCRLYTVVTAENFVSGGSKIGCLRKLFDAGVQIFHLDDLHAKILLVGGDSFVTIGSQNMTHGGTKNREATVVFPDDDVIARRTRKHVREWIDAGKLVTETTVKRIEEAVRQLGAEQRKLKAKVKEATDDIWAEWEREEERKRQAARAAASAARHTKRWTGFKERCASQVIRGEVIQQGHGWSLSNRGATPAPSYCKWEVDWKDDDLELNIGKWRPCFHLDTRQWGKARVYREVISFIDRGMGWSRKYKVGDTEYRISLECRKPDDEQPDYNMEIDVFHFGARVWGTILGNYDVTSLTAETAVPHYHNKKADLSVFQDLMDAINTNKYKLQEKLIEVAMQRKESGSLRNKRIDGFFQPGEVIYTGLRVVNSAYVIVFSRSLKKALGLDESAQFPSI